MESKWFETSFRRNLVDMHIEDWNPSFLSEFDPEVYCENLKKAHIQSAMLYFQSHVGYCYYPTKVGKMHRAFVGKEDAMRRLVGLCHKNGIDVIGYYSLIFNTCEEKRHPEWRLMDGEDNDFSKLQRGSRYGHCCPNNQGYREFVRAQIKEIADYFAPIEGMFYDMTYWSGICHCPACTKRFFSETGNPEIPRKPDFRNPVWRQFVRKRIEWIGEFAHWVTDVSKEYMPGTTVEHNCAYCGTGNWNQASSERVIDACDYCGGDLYSDIYSDSFVNKYYRAVSKSQPFEYMISRCTPNLAQHTMNKTETELQMQILLTAAHHGASFVIDAMDPVGTLDPRVYERIGRAFEKQIPLEPYFEGTPIEDAAIFYPAASRFNTEGQDFDCRTASIALSKMFSRMHLSYGILGESVLDRIGNYRAVFAPAVGELCRETREKICDYVKNGGCFYFSGAEDAGLLRKFFDAECVGYTGQRLSYLAPDGAYTDFFGGYTEKYPMTSKWKLPRLKMNAPDATVAAKIKLPYFDPADPSRFSSIHSDPPGVLTDHPALVFRDYGKGKVIWSAAPLELDGRDDYFDLMGNITERFLPTKERSLLTDAPRQTELISYRVGNRVRISAIDLLCTSERIPLRPFTVKIPAGHDAKKVTVLPGGRQLEHRCENGWVTVFVPETDLFVMFDIEF